MRILLLGANGMLGSSFNDDTIIKLTHKDLDISNYDDIYRVVLLYQPQVIINCTGITDIVFSEKNPDETMLVNLNGVINLASICRRFDIKLIQFSTIFSGNNNIYTKSKMYMENILPLISKNFALLRLPWLFSKKNDKKFLSTTINFFKLHKPIPIYANEQGSPTYTEDIAKYILENIDTVNGVINIGNSGVATRKDWACEVAKCLKFNDVQFRAINRTVFMMPDSRLEKIDGNKVFLRNWKEALQECLS